MYIVEELVHLWVHRNQDDSDGHHHVHHAYSHHHLDVHESANFQTENQGAEPDETNITEEEEPGRSHKNIIDAEKSKFLSSKRRCEPTPTVAILVGCTNPTLCPESSRCFRQTSSPRILDRISYEPGDQNVNTKGWDITVARSALVIVALSIHGCLEGLAMGLEETNGDVWFMFAALCAHKIPIGFSVGMELLEKGVPMKMFLSFMVVFSMASPIVVVVGALSLKVMETGGVAGVLTRLVLQGMSGGTILYVVFCEVLERERCKTKGRLERLLALFSGFVFMVCVGIISPHSLSHGMSIPKHDDHELKN